MADDVPEMDENDFETFKIQIYTQRRKEACCKLTVVILTIITLGQLVALVVAAVKWKETRVEARKEHRVCVNIETVVASKGVVEDIDGVRKCCDKVSVIIDELYTKYSRQRYEEHLWSRFLSAEQPCQEVRDSRVATLKGIDTENSRRSNRIFWHIQTPSTIRGIYYWKGVLTILHAAYYYINAQIKVSFTSVSHAQRFQTSKREDMPYPSTISAGFPDTVRLYMYRFSPRHNKTRLLLERSETECDVITKGNVATIHVGAVFHFHKGDEIYVATSHPERIVPSNIGNYFGLQII